MLPPILGPCLLPAQRQGCGCSGWAHDPQAGCRCSFLSRKFTAGFRPEEVVQWFVNLDPLLKTRLSSSAAREACRFGSFSQFCSA